MRGQVIRFDVETINDFLDTPVILVDREGYPAYSQYLSIYPDHQAIAATLCTTGGKFVLNVDGAQEVVSNTLIFESLSPVINLAYIKKNCWNPTNPSITFHGTRRTRTRVVAPDAPPPSKPPSHVVPRLQASTSALLDAHNLMLQSLY